MPRPLNLAQTAPHAVVAVTQGLGARLRLARQRRRVKLRDLAARAGVAYETARAVERGELATGIGAYVALAWALGVGGEFAKLLDPNHDVEGLALERSRTPSRVRDPKSSVADDDF